MKTLHLLIAVLLINLVSQAQPTPGGLRSPGVPAGVAEAAKDPVNYVIHVEWKDAKADPRVLEILTAEGNFSLDTIQKNTVKINGNDVPTTLKVSGSLRVISDEKGRLELFLGRTVPYVTGSGPGGMSSYSQLSVGLSSNFIVKFGKAQTIQSDENGEILVTVKRGEK